MVQQGVEELRNERISAGALDPMGNGLRHGKGSMLRGGAPAQPRVSGRYIDTK
jgi:hypothetical protein